MKPENNVMLLAKYGYNNETMRVLADPFVGPDGYLDYDWREVFKYAGWSTICHLSVSEDPVPLGDVAPDDEKVPLSPFGPEDVVEVLAYEDGENDGESWVMVGQLRDGRWFSISAGCDYTGWG